MERSFAARAADAARTGAAAELGDDAVESEPNCGSTMPMSRPSTAKSNEPAGACGEPPMSSGDGCQRSSTDGSSRPMNTGRAVGPPIAASTTAT